MQNAELVERLQASHYLYHDLPYSIFFPKLLFVLMLANPLKNITVVRKLHNNAAKLKQRKVRDNLYVFCFLLAYECGWQTDRRTDLPERAR